MSNKKKPDIITSDNNEIIESFYVKEFDWNVIIYILSLPNYYEHTLYNKLNNILKTGFRRFWGTGWTVTIFLA